MPPPVRLANTASDTGGNTSPVAMETDQRGRRRTGDTVERDTRSTSSRRRGASGAPVFVPSNVIEPIAHREGVQSAEALLNAVHMKVNEIVKWRAAVPVVGMKTTTDDLKTMKTAYDV